METYQIQRVKLIRRRTDYIVLVPSTNFIQAQFPISPAVKDSGYSYTWGIWEKYFLKELRHAGLPCHYFIEEIGNDFACIVGQPKYNPSYFIEDLVQSGIIEYTYRNSLVIMMGYNFNLYGLEKRMCTHMASKLISPLLREYDLQPDRVKLIDECYKDNWKQYLKESILDYNLSETKYFDMNILTQFIFKYKNY